MKPFKVKIDKSKVTKVYYIPTKEDFEWGERIRREAIMKLALSERSAANVILI